MKTDGVGGSELIDSRFLDFGASHIRVVSFTPTALTPRKNPKSSDTRTGGLKTRCE
jgi:hypothetical protein